MKTQAGLDDMNRTKTFGIILVILGILGAAYGGFSYTQKTKEAQIGPLSVSVKHKHLVNIPLWVGAGAIVVGGVLLLTREDLGGCQAWSLQTGYATCHKNGPEPDYRTAVA